MMSLLLRKTPTISEPDLAGSSDQFKEFSEDEAGVRLKVRLRRMKLNRLRENRDNRESPVLVLGRKELTGRQVYPGDWELRFLNPFGVFLFGEGEVMMLRVFWWTTEAGSCGMEECRK